MKTKLGQIVAAIVAALITMVISRAASADCKVIVGHRDPHTNVRVMHTRDLGQTYLIPQGNDLVVTFPCDSGEASGVTEETGLLQKSGVAPAVYGSGPAPSVPESVEFAGPVPGDLKSDPQRFAFRLKHGASVTVRAKNVAANVTTEELERGYYTKGQSDDRYAPATGSTAYAPAKGSTEYAPATGSTSYAPMSDHDATVKNTSDLEGLGRTSVQVRPGILKAFNGANVAYGFGGEFRQHLGDVTESAPAIGVSLDWAHGTRKNATVPGVPPVEDKTSQDTVTGAALLCYEVVGSHVIAPLCMGPALMYQHSPETSQGQDTSGRVWVVKTQNDARFAGVASFGVDAVAGNPHHGLTLGFKAAIIFPAGNVAEENGGTAKYAPYGQLGLNLGWK